MYYNGTLKHLYKISNIEHGKTTVDRNRRAFYEYYYDYFYNIIVNYFTWENLPNDIDEIFIEKKLVENGHIAFFEDEKIGYVVQSGTKGRLLNIYDQPTAYIPVNSSRFRFKEMNIAYNENDFNFLKEENKTRCIVIPNNNNHSPYLHYIHLFSEKLADIEMTIQLNRNAQITPFFVFVDDRSILSMKNIFNKLSSFEPVVYPNIKRDKDGQDNFKQIDDYIKVFRTDAPYLLDKLHDEKNRVINQVLTFIGINNNNVDKKERLVTAEAISNNGVISANIEVGWKARRNAVALINKAYGLNISVKPSDYIQEYNIEKVNKELRSDYFNLDTDGGGLHNDAS